jgi:hypothetical protein
MSTDLRKATDLRNEAIRCNNRLRFVIADLSACVQKNRKLTEELKSRPLAQRLSDTFNGKERSVQNEIKQNTARINACLLEALREVNERNRINVEALALVKRLSAELCEALDGCAVSGRSVGHSRVRRSQS